MTDESKLNKDALRGAQAKYLIEHELLDEAFGTLKQTYIDAWQITPVHDMQAREKLYLAVNVIGKVKDQLHSWLSNGTLATKEIESLTAEAKRKRFGIV